MIFHACCIYKALQARFLQTATKYKLLNNDMLVAQKLLTDSPQVGWDLWISSVKG